MTATVLSRLKASILAYGLLSGVGGLVFLSAAYLFSKTGWDWLLLLGLAYGIVGVAGGLAFAIWVFVWGGKELP